MPSNDPDTRILNVRLVDTPVDDGPDAWQFAPTDTVNVGRSSSNEIQLKDSKVSRVHATVAHNGEDWECVSVGTNGVFIQGRLITNVIVDDGTVLQFAKGGPRLHCQLLEPATSDNADAAKEFEVEWIEGLAGGDADAANHLWAEYFDRVVKLAKSRISGRQGRISDGEDVAVSVFQSICAGMQAGRFPDLKDKNSLWRLLCVMTKRKVARNAKHERRQKRGGGQVRGESVFNNAGSDSLAFGLEQFAGTGASGNFGLELAEQAEWLFEMLGDDELRQITELRLAGHTNEEIGEQLGCHVRTIKRRLQTIRSILGSAMEAEA